MSTEPVRIALIGSGRMARVHAASIAAQPGARLVAVAGGSGAAALAQQHGAETLAVEAAFASSAVDAVVIASPNSLHVEHILGAAAGRKAVLVEKPIDLDLARVDACIAQVGHAAERMIVAFNRRFDPSFAAVQREVAAGAIGPLTQLAITSRDPAPPPIEYLPGSGGLFRDMTIHDLDMARFVAGEIMSVHASAQSVDPAVSALGDVTGAALVLTAASGALVTIVNSRSNASGYDQRLEAFGLEGVLEVGNPGTTTVRRSGRDVVGAADPYVSFYGDRYAAAYRAEIAQLVAVTRGGEAPRASLADGRAALVLANAAAESVRTGAVVRV